MKQRFAISPLFPGAKY